MVDAWNDTLDQEPLLGRTLEQRQATWLLLETS
jgi:hypothetical protein